MDSKMNKPQTILSRRKFLTVAGIATSISLAPKRILAAGENEFDMSSVKKPGTNIYPVNNIAEIIEQTGLGPEQHKKIGQLSKGYRQRVGLAQAILHNPQVLILDEPTSGLDPNQLIGIRQLILELGKTKTIILSTHIMQEVEAVCSHVIIINKGKIIADDTLPGLKEKHSGQALENIFITLTKN